MKNGLTHIFGFLFHTAVIAQSVTNGAFSSGTVSWGCGVEANNPESTYGGPSSTNIVAEVDAAAGLCQYITGFTSGNFYQLSFGASRRVSNGPSPATTNVNLSISDGVLSQVVTRTNTTFSLSISTYTFMANSTFHLLSFAAGSGLTGSLGMILDDISISSFSPLPIELLDFTARRFEQEVEIRWQTASEKNNRYFFVETTEDGINWLLVDSVAAAGNSSQIIHYKTKDLYPFKPVAYYRLKQVDFDNSFTYSKIVEVIFEEDSKIRIYPNPSRGLVNVELGASYCNTLELRDCLGQPVDFKVGEATGKLILNAEHLPEGIYFLKLNCGSRSQIHKLSFLKN